MRCRTSLHVRTLISLISENFKGDNKENYSLKGRRYRRYQWLPTTTTRCLGNNRNLTFTVYSSVFLRGWKEHIYLLSLNGDNTQLEAIFISWSLLALMPSVNRPLLDLFFLIIIANVKAEMF